MEKILTIAIPTFNRKEELLKVLKAIESQGYYEYYEIIISNNKSDYNVNEWIEQNFKGTFLKLIKIHNNEYNVGGDINIASIFQLVRTKWMWLSSDDDLATPNAIALILEDIQHFADKCWIKYSIKNLPTFPDKECKTIEDTFSLFHSKKYWFGFLIFIGNNVYNMDAIRDYIGELPLRASTSISQLCAPLKAIKYKGIPMVYRSVNICEYNNGNRSYPNIYAYLNFPNILYVGLFTTKSEVYSFKRMQCTSLQNYLRSLFLVKNRTLRWEYFKRIFIAHFSIFSIKGFLFFMGYIIGTLCPILFKKENDYN